MAISLFVFPSTTNFITSISRTDKIFFIFCSASKASFFAFILFVNVLCGIYLLINSRLSYTVSKASISSSLTEFFGSIPFAPASIAFITFSPSECDEKIIISISGYSVFIIFVSSIPVFPGIDISRIIISGVRFFKMFSNFSPFDASATISISRFFISKAEIPSLTI